MTTKFNKICSIDNCNNLFFAKSLCSLHYHRFNRTGSPHLHKHTVCSVLDCGRKHEAKSYCHKHFENFRRTGNPLGLPKPEVIICSFTGCGDKAYAKSLCSRHYKQKLYNDLSPEDKEKRKEVSNVWKKKNKRKILANVTARKKHIKKATPIWCNKKELETIYANCPINFQVDHIIPIKGKNICGLHVPWNLQYLDNESNLKKSNSFDFTYDNRGWNEHRSKNQK